MKAQDRSNYITCAIVILCSGILLGASTFALTGFSWRAGGRTLFVEFRDATGIKLNSSIRYAGKTAGTITQIRYLSADERTRALDPNNAVRVTVHLNPDVPPLQEGVSASISAETLLGEKFIALTPGKPDGQPLPDGAIIYGATGTSLDAVAASANEAIQKVNAILANFQADYPSLIPRLAGLLAQGSSLLGQVAISLAMQTRRFRTPMARSPTSGKTTQQPHPKAEFCLNPGANDHDECRSHNPEGHGPDRAARWRGENERGEPRQDAR